MIKNRYVKYTQEQILDLVKSCRTGNRHSQQIIYEQYYGKMMLSCMRYTRQKDQAEDWLHDGFIKVFTKLSNYKFNFKGSFEGWMRRIIVNNIIDNLRKDKQHFFELNWMCELNILDDPEDLPETDLDKLSILSSAEILEQIQLLSPAYRTVFNLYIIDGWSHNEISTKLQISEGASKSNLFRAKRNMQKLLYRFYEKKYNNQSKLIQS